MATVTLIEMLASGVVTSAGVPVASGKVRWYDLGTLTPQTVYSDNAGATPITPPLTLTAGGTGIAYFANPVRMIIKDSTDTTTLFDVNVVGGSPASTFITSTSFNGGAQTTLQTILDNVDNSFGGTDWKYKTGTSERTIKSAIEELEITPQDYGAVGDGATDDTSAFTALAAAQLASGRPVFIPKGVYQLSSAVTFSAPGAIIRGASRGDITAIPPTGGAVLRGTNGTMNCLVLSGASPVVENLTITHATSSSGIALSCSNVGANKAHIENVFVVVATYTTAFSNSSALAASAVNCNVFGASIGKWALYSCLINGTMSATTSFGALTSSSATAPLLFSTATTDMANGGNTTPTVGTFVGLPIAHHRIRGTGAGGGTVNATATPIDTKVLILDCFNNSGGAYTFTLNAQYHGTGNPAPANGTRRVVAFVWDPTASVWIEFARSAADVT